MPGRALRNEFIKELEIARKPITKCYNCLEKCEPRSVPYCIAKALIDAVRGDVEKWPCVLRGECRPYSKDDNRT